jgi:hypothetical protein
MVKKRAKTAAKTKATRVKNAAEKVACAAKCPCVDESNAEIDEGVGAADMGDENMTDFS